LSKKLLFIKLLSMLVYYPLEIIAFRVELYARAGNN